MAGKHDSATLADLRELSGRLLGTVAEHVDDPQFITNRAVVHYGEPHGLCIILRVIDEHLTAPQIVENDSSTHSETFIPGVGPVQLSCWPRDYFAEGECPYLA